MAWIPAESTWGPGPLTRAPKNGCRQGLCARVSCSSLLPLWEALQDQQVGLMQAPFKLLLLPRILECVRFCMHSPLALLCACPTDLQSQTFLGLVFPVKDPRLGNSMWDWDPSLPGENLCNHDYPGAVSLDYTVYLHSYPSCCGSFFMSFVVDLFC